ncbi:MAG TPA: prepilin peptidase [Blastocatellia bacterium]|nr:prepilin peptidase [Blastocatellia bacterium]
MPHVTGLDLPISFYAVSAFVLGLIFGSFLNVVIHRVPRGASIVFPGSHCGACGAPIKAFDNIPLLSFALLGGRCRSCRARIPFSYPMVELGVGLIFVAIVFKTGPSWEALFEFAFACVIISLVFIDARHQLLPNAITYPAFLFAVAAAPARAALGGQPSLTFDISTFFPGLQSEFAPWRAALFGGSLFAMAAPGFWLLDRLDPILFGKYFDWEEVDAENVGQTSGCPTIRMTMIMGVIVAAAWAAMVVFLSSEHQPAFEDAYDGLLLAGAGALISGGLVWCIRALYFFIRGFEGMGLGDVKMMSVVGAFQGFKGALGVLLLGSVIGLITGLILIYFRGRGEREFKTPLPFGACLGAAVLIIMTLSPL